MNATNLCDRAQLRILLTRAHRARCTHTSLAVLSIMFAHADYRTGRVGGRWSTRKGLLPRKIVQRALFDLQTAGMILRERERWFILLRPLAKVVPIGSGRANREAVLAAMPAALAATIRAAGARLDARVAAR